MPTHTHHRTTPTPQTRPQDIYSLFHLQRPFKFISKTSNFLIPIVGWSMFLTGVCMV
jgi:1-acyl-sn-glycerol-3-phosphate acyltransferase